MADDSLGLSGRSSAEAMDDPHLGNLHVRRMTTSSPVNHEDEQGKNLRNSGADSKTETAQTIIDSRPPLTARWPAGTPPSKHLSASSCCHTSESDALASRVKMPKALNAQGTPTCAPHPANGVRNGQPTGQDAMPVTTTAAGADRG